MQGITLPDYAILTQIGTGSFANVYRARHLLTNQLVAIKVINMEAYQDNPKDRDFLLSEIDISARANHPLIIQTFDVIKFPDKVIIVMELVEGGNLLELINNMGEIPEEQAKKIFLQLIIALQYLHTELGVVHRDVKAENILLDKFGNIRLIDFGLSKVMNPEQPKFTTVCGSPAYAAPELITGKPYTTAVDIWSAGIILYAMITGFLPFHDENYIKMLHMIVEQVPDYTSISNPVLVDLLRRLLQKNPDDRLSIPHILSHPWMPQGNASLFSSESLYINNLDQDVIEELNRKGAPTRAIPIMLESNLNTPLLTPYKILKRVKITEDLHQLLVSGRQRPRTKTPVGVLPSLTVGPTRLGAERNHTSVRSTPDTIIHCKFSGRGAPPRSPIAVPHMEVGDSPLTLTRRRRARALTVAEKEIVMPKIGGTTTPRVFV